MTKEIFIEGDKDHQDSFWYDGAIATLTNDKETVYVIATGGIDIRYDGEMIYDGKERDNGFPYPIENDNDLAKLFDDPKTYLEMNNWFEVYAGSNEHDGIVCGSYDEAMKVAEDLLKN